MYTNKSVAVEWDEIPRIHPIRKLSDPKEVYKNAKQYFGDENMTLYISNKKDKKYMIVNPDTRKYVHFGQMGYEDFTKHKDETRRENYLTRAKSIRGNWRKNPFSPNNLSIHLLWK